MSYHSTGLSDRPDYAESRWHHQLSRRFTDAFLRSPDESKHTPYQPDRKGLTSSRRRSSGNYERQPVCREPSSRRCPPTSNNKIFDREYAERSNKPPPPRPRSSSQSQSTYTTDFSQPLQRSSSTTTRRGSYSPSQRPAWERSRQPSGVSSESRNDMFGVHKAVQDQYRHVTVVVDDEDASEGRHRRSQAHKSGAPCDDGQRHRTSSRKSSRTGDSRPEGPSPYEMLRVEFDSLLAANIKTQRMAEAAWNRKAWHEATALYERLESDLMRLSELDRHLGGLIYLDYQKQAENAAGWQNMAWEKSISSHKRRYDRHVAEAEAFEHGPDKNLAKANQSYVSAIMILLELGRTSPTRLEANFPGHVKELQCRLQEVQAKIDKQTSEEDIKAANAVKKFIGNFYLVEKLLEQGQGPKARYQFDRAKETLVKTLVTLPPRFVPSKEWVDKMAGAIKDQEKRAKERFGEDW
ncbi:uncharacterized protein PpBr36_10025 [Pyricularia pennisetigena]|uniref:uncharacterized protein n=1 Tax=Pyricularia pennisetigena TaxID=1578925 RepID=UPI001154E913|nr:uncharacterized protein PpBr36_10025 [Pyricularia pennisetigena]TLS22443.1 hypothetical protein PpBr36_10025 [Pyricularia pennisetigena]